MKARLLFLLNEERRKAGLEIFTYRSDISEAANIRAKEASSKWSHTRPDGSEYYTADDKIYGENLAKNYKTSEDIIKAWMNSKSHRQNILDPGFKGVCIGVYETDNGNFISLEFTRDKGNTMANEKTITIAGHGSGFPSKKNMYSYLESRYNQFAKSNGKRKGLIAVRRLKNFTDDERKKFKEAYSTIIGRNYYSQAKRENVFKSINGYFYSDCSSSGDACYAKAGHDVGWLNTAGIYNSSKFESVPVVIKHGHIQNPDVLKVGDALLFVGEDAKRPLQIGHVEYVYDIPIVGWRWVHSGKEWYYQDENGKNTRGWKVINHHWYHFADNGKMDTGILNENGKLYYLMESGDLEGACCKSDNSGELTPWYVD